MSRRSALCVRLFVDRLAQSGIVDEEEEEEEYGKTREWRRDWCEITRENELNR